MSPGRECERTAERVTSYLSEGEFVSKDSYCLSFSVFGCVCASWGKMVEKNDSRGFLNKTSD